MNWGYKIAIVIGLFVAIMITMVIVAFRQTNEMIDKNYYAKELKYQTYIDAGQRLAAITSDRLIIIDSAGLYILIPQSLVSNFANGTIEMLKVDNQSKDQSMTFEVDEGGRYFFDRAQLSSGRYLVRIHWESSGKTYYKEETLYND